jgi:hypothetical protein
MAPLKYKRILFTGESGWGEKDDFNDVMRTFVHEVLGRHDTIDKISEEGKRNKKQRKVDNQKKWEEYRVKRLIDRRKKNKKKKKEEDSETEGESSDEEPEPKPKPNPEPKKVKVEKITNYINFEMNKQMGALKKFNYSKDKNKESKNNSTGFKIFEEGELDEMLQHQNTLPPVIFTRDRKIDMHIRNSLVFTGYRIIQYRAIWKEKDGVYDTDSGIERNNKIFSLTSPPDLVVIFTEFKKQNEGISHIITLAQNKKIPTVFIDRNLVYSSFEPIEDIKTEIIPKIVYDVVDYIELKETLFKNPPKLGSELHKKLIKTKVSRKMERDIYIIDKHTKFLTNKEMLNNERKILKNIKESNKKKDPVKKKKKKTATPVDNILEKIEKLSMEEYSD